MTVAADLGIPLGVVEVDTTGYGASSILVRPDHYVSWVSDGSPCDLASVLGRSIGA